MLPRVHPVCENKLVKQHRGSYTRALPWRFKTNNFTFVCRIILNLSSYWRYTFNAQVQVWRGWWEFLIHQYLGNIVFILESHVHVTETQDSCGLLHARRRRRLTQSSWIVLRSAWLLAHIKASLGLIASRLSQKNPFQVSSYLFFKRTLPHVCPTTDTGEYATQHTTSSTPGRDVTLLCFWNGLPRYYVIFCVYLQFLTALLFRFVSAFWCNLKLDVQHRVQRRLKHPWSRLGWWCFCVFLAHVWSILWNFELSLSWRQVRLWKMKVTRTQ